MVNAKDLKKMATLCRKLGIKRLAMTLDGGVTEIELFDQAPGKTRRTIAAREAELDTGEPMPSDDELLFAATPFFQTEEDRRAENQADDQAEDRK